MNPRAVLRIGSVLVVAAFTALLLRGLFVASTSEAPPPETASIQVAAGALPMGLLLKAEDLTWKAVPVDQVQPGEIRKGTPMAAKLPGAVLRRAADDGATIHENDVVFPDAPGFLAAALKPGMRAVSVAIDDVTGNAGLIQPGDYVDLVLTHQLQADDNPRGHKVASETVLSDMRVIAVGQALRVESETKSQGGNRASARTVTLEVLPRDAEKVAVVTRLGQLSLSLRSLATTRPEDRPADGQDAQDIQPMWGKDVSAVVRMTSEDRPRPRAAAAPAAAAPAPMKVQIFRGSNKDSQATAAAQ